MFYRFCKIGLPLLVASALAPVVQAQHEGYYRFPAVHGSAVIFTSEGDLWKVGVDGGAAVRLTTHPGDETYPALSPDGSMVAFSGEYEGTAELYVMPVAGGLPTRLTWDGSGGTRPVSWTNDGRIVFRTARHSGLPNYRLATIHPESLERRVIPLDQAAYGRFSDDGTLWFVRLPRPSSNARWYKGGTAQTIWTWKPGQEAVHVTGDWPGTSKQPHFLGDRVVFLSDRGGRGMNVWSMRFDGSDLRPHTDYMDWDIQEHSVSGSTVIFRVGADLHRLDLDSGQSSRMNITLVSDFDQQRETWESEPMDYLSSWAISPSGDRAVLVSRGQLFAAPAGKPGRLVQLSRDSGIRFRSAVFAPDGKSVLGMSDESGELEWWRIPADGMGQANRVTDGPAMLRLDGRVSPDGKWMAQPDYDRNLWLISLETGEHLKIADPGPIWSGRGHSPAWSPDSRFVAYAATSANRMASVWVHDLAAGAATQVTTDRYEDYEPAFSADGNWLFFLSDRTLVSSVGSPWGARAPQPHFEKQTGIYAIPLKPGLRFPFEPPDELAADPDSAASSEAVRLTMTDRVYQVPVPRGDFASLTATESRLLFLTLDSGAHLTGLDLKPDAEPVRIVESVSGYDLSADGKKVLVRKGRTLAVVAVSAGAGAKLDDAVDLSNWRVALDPRAEWRQIFVDAWRLHRDYFWDPAMHGVDWEAVRAQYEPLVGRVASRNELTDIQAQMISHLSLLHSNAGGGDTRSGSDNVQSASLGARLAPVAAGLRVEHVFRTDPDLPGERAPLARLGVEVAEGAVITAVDGVSLAGAPEIGPFLRGKSGEQVRLSVLESGGTRDVVVRPVSLGEETDLRYDEWEYTRRLEVDERGEGQIGYVHLRAMGSSNIAEWTREFYPVFNRAGLIVDVRHNNGGNIEAWILEQLLRQAWMFFKGRTGDPFWNMHYAFRGHVVVLVDERTASDGEAFAEGFRRLGLGAVIGTRTWGGEIWLSGSNRQVDGGVVRASEAGVYGPEGEWLIEGWGVEPDLEVDNLPHETFNGRDAQLEAAIAHLQQLIESDPRPIPPPPAWPVVTPGEGFPTSWRNR